MALAFVGRTPRSAADPRSASLGPPMIMKNQSHHLRGITRVFNGVPMSLSLWGGAMRGLLALPAYQNQ